VQSRQFDRDEQPGRLSCVIGMSWGGVEFLKMFFCLTQRRKGAKKKIKAGTGGNGGNRERKKCKPIHYTSLFPLLPPVNSFSLRLCVFA
jgi:hypothetical protein